MRFRVYTLMVLRSRSLLPTAIPPPRFTSGLLSSLEMKASSSVLPPFPQTEDHLRRRYSELNVQQLTRPAFDFTFTHPDKAIHEVLRDFVEKNRSSSTYLNDLWNLLTSARLKDLGVGYKPIPIPNKQEWKASWNEEGKPNWLGTIPTHADGRLYYTASITGCTEKDGGKGGYGVILFDHYGRPKVASVGISLKCNVPVIYYQFQGVRSALQLAFDHGFGAKIKLYCDSDTVHHILDLCLQHTSCTPPCMGKPGPWDGSKLCSSCVGQSLFRQRVMEDFDLLFPVIEDILDLFYKIQNFRNIEVAMCCGSGHLAKHFSTSTTQDEINQYGLLVDKLELYEMVMKPDKLPEEVDDSIYDEVFKGYRVHSELITVEKVTEASEYTHPEPLFDKLSDYCTYQGIR